MDDAGDDATESTDGLTTTTTGPQTATTTRGGSASATGFPNTGTTGGPVTGGPTGTWTTTGTNTSTNTSTGTTGSGGATTGGFTTGVVQGGAGGTVATSTSSITGSTGVVTPPWGQCDTPYNLGTLVGTVSSFTRDPGTFYGDCGGEGSDVFFLWQAPETATYSVDTFGSDFDTVLYQLEEPNCNNRGVVQCQDDSNNTLNEQLFFDAVAGEYVTFVVDSYDRGTLGQRYQLRVQRASDNCAQQPLGSLSGVGEPAVAGAVIFDERTLSSAISDDCNGGAPRMVFEWRPPVDGIYEINTNGSNYDTVLGVRYSCDATYSMLCDDDGGISRSSKLVTEFYSNQSVWLDVAAFSGVVDPGDSEARYELNILLLEEF